MKQSIYKIIPLLKEIIDLCEANNIRYWIVGGFAIDGKIGQISRKHCDIDICFHSFQQNKIFEIFFNNNFTIIRQGLKYVFYKYAIKIDVFILFDGKNVMEEKEDGSKLNFPR